MNFILALSLLSSCASHDKSTPLESAKAEKSEDSALSTPTQVKKIDTINISAEKLLSDYVANEVKADYDYKGKALRVTGLIQDIKKGITDNIFIILDGKMQLRAVQCFVNDEETARKLSRGQKVTILGTCDGLLANVLVMNSTIEKF